MDHEMADMGLDRLIVPGGFSGDRLEGHDDVAEQRRGLRRSGSTGREGQDIGRLVHAAPLWHSAPGCPAGPKTGRILPKPRADPHPLPQQRPLWRPESVFRGPARLTTADFRPKDRRKRSSGWLRGLRVAARDGLVGRHDTTDEIVPHDVALLEHDMADTLDPGKNLDGFPET